MKLKLKSMNFDVVYFNDTLFFVTEHLALKDFGEGNSRSEAETGG